MSIKEILQIWKECCARVNVDWFLYKETLLCAQGRPEFPNELKWPQVVVFGKDLQTILQVVIPKLPQGWGLQKESFALNKDFLHLENNGETILEIYVLWDVKNQEEVDQNCKKLRRMRAFNRKVDHFFKLFGKPIKKIRNSFMNKQFIKIISIAEEINDDFSFYSDSFNIKHGALYGKYWFSNTEYISIEGEFYPVFSAYREYLYLHYGDYENGLSDDIGCGLTAEEKIHLKKHQQRCREALAFVETLSQEFNLHYYLLAGSVLGAVRHGGFIPWDDDVDIGICREELERFETLVEKFIGLRLPEGFELVKPEIGGTYPRMFSKICYKGRCCIDLWPLIPTHVDGIRAKILWGIGKVITKVHYKKIGYKVTRFRKIVKLVSPFVSDRLVMRIARINEQTYIDKKVPAYINLYSIYRRKKETILLRWIEDEKRLDFDGIQVPVIGCTEEYLTHLYGDYMKAPAPWKRASRHVERFNISTETIVNQQ